MTDLWDTHKAKKCKNWQDRYTVPECRNVDGFFSLEKCNMITKARKTSAEISEEKKHYEFLHNKQPTLFNELYGSLDDVYKQIEEGII